MSCTIMYQPYAMSYPSCDRSASEKSKLFKFPHAPSPPDSLHSDASSYSSPGPSSGGTASSSSAASSSSVSHSHSHSRSHNLSSSQSQSRRPLTPSCSSTGALGGGSSHSRASATVTSSHTPHNSHSHSNTNVNENHRHSLQQSQSPAATATSATHSSQNNEGGSGGNGSHQRGQYLASNSILYINYSGDVTSVVDEHFHRALNYQTEEEKPSKYSPMSTRNFPPSFWNSNYQPPKPFPSYGTATAADFYGAAVDCGTTIPSFAHHHQTDTWHYPLSTHQSYHHRSTDIPYPAMPSTSRFNAAQYGSFLLAGAAAAGTAAGRYPAMSGSSQCGVSVKGDSSPWTPSRYHPYHHESLSDFHLTDHSVAAAAYYSNMTAGLESSVPEATKDWFQ